MYKAENIDTDKFLEAIDQMEKSDTYKQIKETAEIIKYHEGYKKALFNVKDMFYCANYEKKEVSNAK